jgi:hypothetical protein
MSFREYTSYIFGYSVLPKSHIPLSNPIEIGSISSQEALEIRKNGFIKIARATLKYLVLKFIIIPSMVSPDEIIKHGLVFKIFVYSWYFMIL